MEDPLSYLRVIFCLVTATSAAVVSAVAVVIVTAACKTDATAVLIKQAKNKKDNDNPDDPGEVA